MRTIKFIVFLSLLSLCLFSCHKEDAENKVRFIVECSEPHEPVYVCTVGFNGTIKGRWEEEIVTEKERLGLEATCKDPDAVISVEIYVNGRLKVKTSKNTPLKTGLIDLK